MIEIQIIYPVNKKFDFLLPLNGTTNTINNLLTGYSKCPENSVGFNSPNQIIIDEVVFQFTATEIYLVMV